MKNPSWFKSRKISMLVAAALVLSAIFSGGALASEEDENEHLDQLNAVVDGVAGEDNSTEVDAVEDNGTEDDAVDSFPCLSILVNI